PVARNVRGLKMHYPDCRTNCGKLFSYEIKRGILSKSSRGLSANPPIRPEGCGSRLSNNLSVNWEPTMNLPDTSHLQPTSDAHYASWLLTVDEMLATGISPLDHEGVIPNPGQDARFDRGAACVQKLHELWPRPVSPADATFPLSDRLPTPEEIPFK